MTFASLGRKIRQIQVRFVAGLDDGAIWKVDLNAGVDGRGINTRCIGFYIMAASTCIREKCRRGGDREGMTLLIQALELLSTVLIGSNGVCGRESFRVVFVVPRS